MQGQHGQLRVGVAVLVLTKVQVCSGWIWVDIFYLINEGARFGLSLYNVMT